MHETITSPDRAKTTDMIKKDDEEYHLLGYNTV
jgi:hypothetical protein